VNGKYRRALEDAIGESNVSRVETGGFTKTVETRALRQYSEDTLLGHFANTVQRNVMHTPVARGMHRFSNWMQGVNGSMENAFRRESYLTAAEKEMTRNHVQTVADSFWRSKRSMEDAFRVGLDQGSSDRVIAEMNKTMNDYNSASPLARNIIRPYLVPFYAFYRHAAKTLLTMPFEHPAKARRLELLSQADDERMRADGIDPSSLPGWMKGGALYTGMDSAGSARFLSSAGVNPFNTVLDAPYNMLNPAFKVLYEQGTGRSSFTGNEYSDQNVVQPFGGAGQVRIEIGPDGKPVPVPVETVQPGLLEHLLQQIPQYDMVKDLVAGGNTYDTTTLIDVLRYRFAHGDDPVLRDPVTGKPYTERTLISTVARIMGYNEFSKDVVGAQAKDLANRATALQTWLQAHPGEPLTAPAAKTSYLP
jgi:hypothetical protein